MATNGPAYDGSTVEVNVTGIGRIGGIDSVSWGVSKETNKVFGSGDEASGRTPGRINADDASMEIWLATFEDWKSRAGSMKAFMKSKFDVTITKALEGQPLRVTRLIDCTPIAVASTTNISASDNDVLTVTISVMRVEGDE
jgi:hypothetical protein